MILTETNLFTDAARSKDGLTVPIHLWANNEREYEMMKGKY